MKEKCLTQVVEDIPGRRVILSAGIGQTNPTDLQWLMDTVLKHAVAWKASGWAYIADCTKMKPIGPQESSVLVKMTKAFVDAGCKAFGFAEKTGIDLPGEEYGILKNEEDMSQIDLATKGNKKIIFTG